MNNFGGEALIVIPGAKVFEQAKEGDAGYDIWSIETLIIPSKGTTRFRTGIATAFDPNWVGLVLDRGGWGFKGLMRQAGVFDSNWRGEWLVQIYNSSDTPLEIESVLENPKAKAMCQVVFVPCGQGPLMVVDALPKSVRGALGFGSSDK